MAELFRTGGIVDLIIGLTLVEALALVLYRRLTGRGLRATALIFNLTAGAALLLALRIALVGGAWGWVAACLAAALAAHLGDLWQRWGRAAPGLRNG